MSDEERRDDQQQPEGGPEPEPTEDGAPSEPTSSEEEAVPEVVSPEEPHEHGEEGGESEEEPAPEEAGHEALAQALRGSFRWLKVAMVLLVAFYLLKGIFSVEMNETGFKLRFGKIVPAGDEQAAFVSGEYYIQFPWEEVELVSTAERVLNIDQEFWATQRAGEAAPRSLDVRRHGFLVTGDANIVHLKLRVRYRVGNSDSDVKAFLFALEDPEAILRRMAMASTAKVVSSMPVMDVIGRRGLFEKILVDLQARMTDFKTRVGIPLGIELVAVEAVELPQGAPGDVRRNPTEPLEVKDAFEDIIKATSDRGTAAEEGRNRANYVISNAEAKAREIIAEAEGDKQRLISFAQADAQALTQLLEVYDRSPEEATILRDTLYQAALKDVLRDASDSFVLYEMADDARREIRFMLGRQPARRRESAPGE
jgi:membrane protease subunit HflK